MTAFFNALADVPRVVVLTVHAERGYTARNNELIFSLARPLPQRLADRLECRGRRLSG